jgi:hypothetical protein
VYVPPVQLQAAPQTNLFAILSFATVFYSAIPGIVFGHIALKQLKTSGESGRGLAIAGVIIGYISIVMAVLAVIAYMVVLIALMSGFSQFVTMPGHRLGA